MDSCVIFLPEDRAGTEALVAPASQPNCLERLLERIDPMFQELLLSAVPECRPRRSAVPVIMSPPRTGGRLASLHAAIQACEGNPIFALNADRPLISVDLVRHMRRLAEDFDVVIPRHLGHYDPLCAFYTRRCLRPMEAALDLEYRRVASFFEQIRLRCVDTEEIQQFDPHLVSLQAIETDAEYDATLERITRKPAPPRRRATRRRKKPASRK